MIVKISVDSRAEISEIAASVFNSGSLAQLVEHFTFNEGVDGSNPSRATKFFTPALRDKKFPVAGICFADSFLKLGFLRSLFFREKQQQT